jgi:transcriptional regulator with XRE-family HTH domain
MKIGKKLKELRLQKKLSLEQLAKKVGLTRSFLSQVEKDKTSPSIASLIKILSALNVKMADFFQAVDKTKGIVLRKDQKKFFYDQKSKIKLASLSTGFSNPKMEPFYAEMEPGSSSEFMSSEGQTFCFILTGTIELTLEEETYVLKRGDSVYFDSSVPHQWKAVGSKGAAGIWVTNESFLKIL